MTFTASRGELPAPEPLGVQLLVDLHQGTRLDDIDWMHQALDEIVRITGATPLHTHLHHFTPHGGITGVVVLAESHITLHTWPEFGYAAFDLFMCGQSLPEKALKVLEHYFEPEKLHCDRRERGSEILVSDRRVDP